MQYQTICVPENYVIAYSEQLNIEELLNCCLKKRKKKWYSGPDYQKGMRSVCFASKNLKGPRKSAKHAAPNCIFSQLLL